jgi:hypothetical protein
MGAPLMRSQLTASQLQREADRCDQEIKKCIAELQNGNPDVHGLLRGLMDWCAEKRLIKEEINGYAWASSEANSARIT